MKGEKVRGIGMTLTQLLKGQTLVDEFMLILRDFITVIAVDTEVERDVKQMVNRFSFTLKIFNKFDQTFKKFDFSELKGDHPE